MDEVKILKGRDGDTDIEVSYGGGSHVDFKTTWLGDTINFSLPVEELRRLIKA